MTQEQFVEGEMKGCEGYSCKDSCCDYTNEDEGVEAEEWINEFFAFHERMKDHLISHGIEIEFIDDRVKFRNCSDGQECKLLKYSLNKDIDPRPLDCKLYPFIVDWKSIDFDKKIVHLYYTDNICPLVKNKTVPDSFKKEVENIVKRDFAVLFYGSICSVEFMNKVYKG